MGIKGNWILISSEAVSIPVYWPGQDRKESDTGMKSKYECRFCGFRKSWWHKKGITPDLYKYCPNCGKEMITEVSDEKDLQ